MVRDPEQAAATLTGPALHDAKQELRARIVAARDAMGAADRGADSDAIAARISALPSFRDARRVLLTLPFRSEWNTRPLIDAALAAGKTLALPRVDTVNRMLDICIVRDISLDCAPGYRTIPEPHAHVERVAPDSIDWVLVPGVAFDVRGQRLGYGGGYYDRLLAQLPRLSPRVAGAFDAQVVDRVPAAQHDLVVDTLVTPTRVLTFPREP